MDNKLQTVVNDHNQLICVQFAQEKLSKHLTPPAPAAIAGATRTLAFLRT